MPQRFNGPDLLASPTPLVVGVISDLRTLAEMAPQQLERQCDLIELRLDSLGKSANVLEFARSCPLPILATARGTQEGGENNLSITERAEHYQAILPHCDLIDIELSSFKNLSAVIDQSRGQNTPVIGSYHNFEHCPPLSDLLETLQNTSDHSKIALQIDRPSDLQTLFNLLENPDSLSVMGMGPIGSASRPLLAQLGSVFNYGYLGNRPTAPGQWPASLLKMTLAAQK